MGLLTDLLGDGNGTSVAFDIDPKGASYSNTNFSTVQQNAGGFGNGWRVSSGAQDAEVVFGLAASPDAGTYSLALLARRASTAGVAHLAVSTDSDASTWTELATFDCYAGVDTPAGRLTASGVQVPSGVKFVRVKMETKNASAGNYLMWLQGISGVRTGNPT